VSKRDVSVDGIKEEKMIKIQFASKIDSIIALEQFK
jgi:hypothetical protein